MKISSIDSWCLDLYSCLSYFLFSSLVLWLPCVLLWKSSFAKQLDRFGVVYNQRNLSATSSQSFLFLCGWFLCLWLLQETIWSITLVASSWKQFNSHPRHCLYYLILPCEVYSFSPKYLWANLRPLSSVVTSFITENNESVFSLTWCTCDAALSVF